MLCRRRGIPSNFCGRWLISARGLGALTGEVGCGKTVAVRAAVAGLDPSRHTLIYLPNPQIGVRGIHSAIVKKCVVYSRENDLMNGTETTP